MFDDREIDNADEVYAAQLKRFGAEPTRPEAASEPTEEPAAAEEPVEATPENKVEINYTPQA